MLNHIYILSVGGATVLPNYMNLKYGRLYLDPRVPPFDEARQLSRSWSCTPVGQLSSRHGAIIPRSTTGVCPATLTRPEDYEQHPLGGHSTVAGELAGSSSVPRAHWGEWGGDQGGKLESGRTEVGALCRIYVVNYSLVLRPLAPFHTSLACRKQWEVARASERGYSWLNSFW